MSEAYLFTELYSAFARKLFQGACRGREGQNLILSPFSVLMVLAMAADAAAGQTREEILVALSGREGRQDVLDSIVRTRTALSGNSSFSFANAVCVRHDLAETIVPGYDSRLRTLFGGEIFSSRNMAEDVNRWVREQTRGFISRIADDSMNDMLACLLNASSFEGKWTRPYEADELVREVFRSADGTERKIPMIRDTESLYVEDASYTGFVKPYQGKAFSFMALLPREPSSGGIGPHGDLPDFSALFRSRNRANVRILLPEFRDSSDINLFPVLQALGICTVFTDRADFSPLSASRLRLEALLHKARIEVDRKGTRAAAVTAAVVAAGYCPPPDFRVVELTRPFLYAIMHDRTGLPLFIGLVNRL